MGDDWAEDHHDVHLMNDDGKKLASRRLPEGLDGIRVFHELVADHVNDPGEVVVGIETDRGFTGLGSAALNNTMVGNGASWLSVALPNCSTNATSSLASFAAGLPP